MLRINASAATAYMNLEGSADYRARQIAAGRLRDGALMGLRSTCHSALGVVSGFKIEIVH